MDATVQLNARMSRSLKESGDAALAQIGLSPTQAVRALWRKASRRGKDLEEVAALLVERDESQAQDAEETDDALKNGWTLVEDMLASYGLSYEPPSEYPDEKEMLEEALYERYMERELA